MKKLFALLGTYAAGVAVAMKLRKNAGKSKLANETRDITLGEVFDEIADIHKDAYADIKNFIVPLFEDVESFDELKQRFATMTDDWSEKLESTLTQLKEDGAYKKESVREMIDDAKETVDRAFESAKEKAQLFVDADTKQKIDRWIVTAGKKIEKTYNTIKEKAEKML